MEKHMFEKLFFRKVFKFILVLLLFSCSVSGYAEVLDNRVVKGVVKDELGEPLPAVTVVVKGTTNGVTTDLDGEYTLSNVPAGSTLVFSFLGMQTQEIVVRNQKRIDVEMKEDAVSIDEVVVVAFGTQKKESMVSSIQTVKPAALKVPSSNLTTALAGRMSGLIAYQRSGEPGQDNADFFIRGVTTFGYKKDPLILIDGIETTSTELARLQPDDIAAFSILKDATATALYGARGANGVIQVQTKEGKEGPAKVSLRVENSFSSNTSNIELADPITYMQMANNVEYTNPYTELNKGYKDYSKSTMDAQFELKQDLSFITKGLNVRGLFNTSRYAYFEVGRASSPYFYNVSSYDKGGSYSIMQLNEDSNPTEYLESTGSWTDVQSTVYMEAAMSYNRSIGMGCKYGRKECRYSYK